MANTQCSRLLTVGEYVYYRNILCCIQEIRNELGFNRYLIVDMNTGASYQKCWCELEAIDPETLKNLNMAIKEMEQIKPETEEKKKISTSNRRGID